MLKSKTFPSIIFFIFLTLAFFYKIFFGLIPLPTDLIAGGYFPWVSLDKYSGSVPVHNPKLSDAVSIIYPLKVLAIDLIKKGELPLWNPYMFAGYPLFASVDLALLFPTMLFYLFLSPVLAWTFQTMFQPFLGLVFMFILLRHLKLRLLPALFGSIAFAFSGFQILWLQWNTQATTSMFLPILIYFEDRYLTERQTRWGIFFSIFLALQILAGYMPVIIFTFLALFIWYLSKTRVINFKFVLFMILGILLSGVFLLPAWELFQSSQRSIETFNPDGGMVPWQYLLSFFAPDFFGNHATGNFWGVGDYMSNAFYTGAATTLVVMAGLGKVLNKTAVKAGLAILIISLIIIIFNPIGQFLYNLGVWGGSSVGMNKAIFLINFSLSLISAFVINSIKESYKNINLKVFYFVLLFFMVLGLLLYFPAFRQFFSLSANQVHIALRNLSLPIVLIFLIALLLTAFKKLKFNIIFLQIFLIIILTADLFRFGLKFNTFSKIDYLYPENPLSSFLQKYPNDRMISQRDIFPANMWVPFGLESIQGYDSVYPLNIARYLAVAASKNIGATAQPRWGVIDTFDSQMIDAANTRFILGLKKNGLGEAKEKGEISKNLQSEKYKKVFEYKEMVVLENQQAFPRVYLTEKATKASDAQVLINLLTNPQLKTIAYNDKINFNSTWGNQLDYKLGYQKLSSTHNQIVYRANKSAYMVVLNSFYPGWKAFIDKKETTLFRTNYNFQGLVVQKGNHTIDIIYRPQSLQAGGVISLTSILILIYLGIRSRGKRMFKKGVRKVITCKYLV